MDDNYEELWLEGGGICFVPKDDYVERLKAALAVARTHALSIMENSDEIGARLSATKIYAKINEVMGVE